jgi:hypothetical protein
MTKSEQIARLKAALLHQKTCYYGGHRCSYPEARAKRDIEKLLGEPVTPHPELDYQERESRYFYVNSGE